MTTATRQPTDPHGLIPPPAPDPRMPSHRPAHASDCADRAVRELAAAAARGGEATRRATTPVASVVRGGCGSPKCHARTSVGGSCLCGLVR